MADVTLRIKVRPRCKNESVISEGDYIIVRVNAPAEKGKANEAVIALLAKTFDVPKRDIVIVSGHTSKYKNILVPEKVLPLIEDLKIN